MKKNSFYYLRLTAAIILAIISTGLLINKCSTPTSNSVLDTIEKNMTKVGYKKEIYSQEEEEDFVKTMGKGRLNFTEPTTDISANFGNIDDNIVELHAVIHQKEISKEENIRLWVEIPLGLFMSFNTKKDQEGIKKASKLFQIFSQTILGYALGKTTLEPWGITEGGYNLFFPEIETDESGNKTISYVIIKCKEETSRGCRGF